MDEVKYTRKFKDFEECSVLFYEGFPIQELEREGKTIWFHFQDNDHESEQVLNDFHNYKIEGNIKKFADAQNNIRRRFKSFNV